MPLLYAVECATSACNGKNKLIFTVIFNLGALIFLFYCNKYYNALYALFTGKLPLLFFFIADMLPLLFLLLPKDNPKLSTL